METLFPRLVFNFIYECLNLTNLRRKVRLCKAHYSNTNRLQQAGGDRPAVLELADGYCTFLQRPVRLLKASECQIGFHVESSFTAILIYNTASSFRILILCCRSVCITHCSLDADAIRKTIKKVINCRKTTNVLNLLGFCG
jgi:hypothetical protein